MKYLLITKRGTVMCFYVKSVAEMYLTIHGGVICDCAGIETTLETANG